MQPLFYFEEKQPLVKAELVKAGEKPPERSF